MKRINKYIKIIYLHFGNFKKYMKNINAVEWLIEQLPIRIKNYLQEEIIKSKEMQQEFINQLDWELGSIEEIANGDVRNKISELRKKIQ